MYDNDPLWKLRHALAGLGLSLLLSIPVAALIGSTLGDALGGTYGWRVGAYALLLAHVVAGAVVLFIKVARHETRPITLPRLLTWLASLWLWPLLLVAAGASRRRGSSADAPTADRSP